MPVSKPKEEAETATPSTDTTNVAMADFMTPNTTQIAITLG